MTELAVTVMPFALAWIAIVPAVHFRPFWLLALLMLPTADFVVRLFIIRRLVTFKEIGQEMTVLLS